SFNINDRDRIGLTGKNGAGKSTLLRILKGIQVQDEGEIVVPDGNTIGYLPQEMRPDSLLTVFGETLTAFSEILGLQDKISFLEKEIADRTDFDSPGYHRLLREHADTLERFHLMEGQSIHVNVEKVLTGLGFEPSDFHRPLREFSSGWQMRVELAKILLYQPDLVLLDEPTNHLDIESIQWLEEFLSRYKGAVILVSHDRAFLDQVTSRTLEISMARIYDFRAGYSEYEKMREERLESQVAAFNNQQRQIRQIERFIERFRYKSTKARQVQSRIRMLEKMEEVEVDIPDNSVIRFRFPPAPQSGKIILEAKHLEKDYPGKRVLRDINFTMIRTDRIAFVGRNGEGKTTLSKIIAGKTDFGGLLKFGHHIVTGFYAQELADNLDPDKTVFDTIDEVATGDIRPKIRNLLGGFLFSGDDTEKKVKVLSGGEKSRLSLARLLLVPSNLLILDEPTNHLDMRSKDILKNALIHYDGALIVVSHDRDFLQGLTNRVFEFRNGGIKETIGDIYDFLEAKKLQSLSMLEMNAGVTDTGKEKEPVSDNKRQWEKRRNQEKETRKIRSRLKKCEEEIEQLELQISSREAQLSNPGNSSAGLSDRRFYEEYEALKERLHSEMEQWEQLHNELQKLEKDFSGDTGSRP
ncbi:MAG TPA: ABC-F family ATP-binding cassette domain-containing protein, partial [Bacteroidales bacterium]|nr:ABC-F family ATP-binding cassette domain-containing protein [Bacteroidales bacterium]